MATDEKAPRSQGPPRSSSVPLDTIHHIAVVVSDIEEGVSWYTKHFHCIIEYIDETWALLQFANTKLALVLPHQHPAHFAIVREDAEKFGTLTTHRDGLKSIYMKDIAGNPLEILKEEAEPDAD
ncbi:MAG: VOC family protein [Nitrospirales bacterium]|nr:VOC family protein [Nitrospira sp.]MDR4500083.1 VOC family protein [Nitrospirales bacterium]